MFRWPGLIPDTPAAEAKTVTEATTSSVEAVPAVEVVLAVQGAEPGPSAEHKELSAPALPPPASPPPAQNFEIQRVDFANIQTAAPLTAQAHTALPAAVASQAPAIDNTRPLALENAGSLPASNGTAMDKAFELRLIALEAALAKAKGDGKGDFQGQCDQIKAALDAVHKKIDGHVARLESRLASLNVAFRSETMRSHTAEGIVGEERLVQQGEQGPPPLVGRDPEEGGNLRVKLDEESRLEGGDETLQPGGTAGTTSKVGTLGQTTPGKVPNEMVLFGTGRSKGTASLAIFSEKVASTKEVPGGQHSDGLEPIHSGSRNLIGPGYITSRSASAGCFLATRKSWLCHGESYMFRESTWDLCIFAFCDLFSPRVSSQMVLMFLLNLFMQCFLVYFIAMNFTSGDIDQAVIEQLQRWRHTVAHDSKWMDSVSHESLARKVCERSSGLFMSGSIKDLLATVLEYKPDERFEDLHGVGLTTMAQWQGVILCLFSLIIWWNTCSIEFSNVGSCALAIFHCPNTKGATKFLVFREEHEVEAHEGGVIKLDHVYVGRKFWGLLVCCIRFCIASALTVSGSYYLIYTLELQDLILNAIALNTVLDFDEILFQSSAEFHSRQFIQCLAPVNRPSVAQALCGLRLRPGDAGFTHDSAGNKGGKYFGKGQIIQLTAFGLLGLLALLVAAFTPQLVAEVGYHQQAQDAICGGYLDFVYVIDPGGAIAAHPTKVGADSMPPVFVKDGATCPTAGAASTNGYEWQAVSELIQSCHKISSNVANSLSDNTAGLTGSRLGLVARNLIPVGERMRSLNPNCADLYETANVMVWPDEFLTQMMLLRDTHFAFMDCSEVKARCNWDNATGINYRQWCSKTCGCNAPNSGLILSRDDMGCPNSCFEARAYMNHLAAAPCTDLTNSSAAFQEYILGVKSQRNSYAGNTDWYNMFDKWILQLGKHGCAGHVLTHDGTPTGASLGDLCSETTFKLKPLINLCPVTCGCGPGKSMPTGQAELCPTSCR